MEVTSDTEDISDGILYLCLGNKTVSLQWEANSDEEPCLSTRRQLCIPWVTQNCSLWTSTQ